jgi:hypothetical protein
MCSATSAMNSSPSRAPLRGVPRDDSRDRPEVDGEARRRLVDERLVERTRRLRPRAGRRRLRTRRHAGAKIFIGGLVGGGPGRY